MNGTTERIRAHIETLLQSAPHTKAMDELREELYGGCCDKYNGLLAAGRTEEEAYAEVIAGIGDVDELVAVITRAKEFDPTRAEDNRRKRATYVCAGIAVFMVSLLIAAFLSQVAHMTTTAGLFVLSGISAATIMIAFGVITTPYKYEKQEDTIVEDLKTSMARGGKQQRLLGAASSSLWTMTTVVYLLASFLTGWWHVTWLLFLAASVFQVILKAYFSPRGITAGTLGGILWTSVTLLYFLVSFVTHAWHVTWVIFILAAAAQQIIRLLSIWKE